MHKLKKYTPLKVYDVIKMTLIWKGMKFIFKLLSLALRLQALEEKACLGNLQIQKETKRKNPNQLFHLCLLKVSILASVLILCTCTSTVMTSMFQTCFFPFIFSVIIILDYFILVISSFVNRIR